MRRLIWNLKMWWYGTKYKAPVKKDRT